MQSWKPGEASVRRGWVRSSFAADRARARARGLALPLLALVVPWQAWWRSGFLSTGLHEAEAVQEPQKATDQLILSLEDGAEARGTQRTASDEAAVASEAPELGIRSTLPAEIRLAVFDLAGTTLDDLIDGQPLAVTCICAAFQRAGREVSVAAVTAHRGLEKKEAIRQLLSSSSEADADQELVDRVYGFFGEALDEALKAGPVREVSGTSETFKALRSRGVRIVVGSGFSEDVVRSLVDRLGWQVDGLVSAKRPKPDAVFEAMRLMGVENAREVLKVGDTVADIEEGRNAGAWTAAVLTGTQGEAMLREASPDFVLSSVANIPSILPHDDTQSGETPA